MNFNFTIKIALIFVSMTASFQATIFAQPINDNVCDAIDLTSGVSVFINNEAATVQAGETQISPPFRANCGAGGWCDITGLENTMGSIDNSIWFKFDAPASGAVELSACMSDFDNQLAVYEVGNCADFSSFSFVWATENEVGCGTADAEGLASEMILECLTPGQTYYILLDGREDVAVGGGLLTGDVDMVLTNISPSGINVEIDTILGYSPPCEGGTNGQAFSFITSGAAPYTYAWSTGATTENISDLSAGTYTLTVTDACGTTDVGSVTLEDGSAAAEPLVLSVFDGNIVHPSNCDDGTIDSGTSGADGQIHIGVASGAAPYTYAWSNGATTPSLTDLAAGTYTVTVTDACGSLPAIQSFTLETEGTGTGSPAGLDTFVCEGDSLQIGGDFAPARRLSQLTYSLNQVSISNIACFTPIEGYSIMAQNSYWRAFDLDGDFGLSGEVQIEGVDFVLAATAGPGFGNAQPISFGLYIADNMNLSVANLTPIATINTQVADMFVDYYRAPLKATVDASDILVVEISHPGPLEDLHQFSVGANSTPTARPTYLSSTDCGVLVPTPVTQLNSMEQTIMNVIYSTNTTATYAWETTDGTLSNTDSANPTISMPGTYSVTVTDDCGTSITDEVTITAGTETECFVNVIEPESAVFTVTPNPASTFLSVQRTANDEGTIVISDLNGRPIIHKNITSNTTQVSIEHLPEGMYVVHFYTASGSLVKSGKLIVVRG